MATQPPRSDVSLWRAPDLGADLLRGQFANFAYDVHTHDTACFALLTQGAIRIRTRGSEFIARRGDLYAIDADEPHAGWPVDDTGWKLRTIYVDMHYLQAQIGDERGARHVSLAGPIIRDPELAAMLYGVHVCSQTQGPPLVREEQYLAFIARLFERHARHAAAPDIAGNRAHAEAHAVRLAKAFIDEHLHENVNLAMIARAAGLPVYRLFRAFDRSTGMTPHGYQRQARVRSAMTLIRRQRPLSDVAAATGFADQAHLTRAFRKVMGITPGRYKQAFAD